MNGMEAADAALAGGAATNVAGRDAPCAIVLGAGGRVGGAFVRRLRRDGYLVLVDPADPGVVARTVRPYLFDCAYRDGDAEGHVQRVAGYLVHWRDYAGIFLPSSAWIGEDTEYGRSKRVVEALAAFYQMLGANVVTDRIGYFPGDSVAPDPAEPMIAQLVDGDALYARVMARLLVEERSLIER